MVKKDKLVIVVDFDGTCTTHDFPRIGKDIGAVPVLKKLVANGHKLVLFTMRSDAKIKKTDDVSPEKASGQYLQEAVDWFKEHEIPLYGIQKNPTQIMWTTSPKAYGQLIIDDAALGCPLKEDKELSDRPFVDWVDVEDRLVLMGLIEWKEVEVKDIDMSNVKVTKFNTTKNE